MKKDIQETKKKILESLKGYKEIVINKRFGGFELSHQAVMRYAELKGIKLYPKKENLFTSYYKVPPEQYEKFSKKWFEEDGNHKRINAKNWYFSDGDIERDDETLVKVVKELGTKADGSHAELKIIKIPLDVDWEIEEYDGNESIHEKHRSWN